MPETDNLPPAPSGLPQPERRKRARWLPSLVWLIPIVAAVVGISLLIHTLASRGPEITVTFRSAEGLTPGKTAVRYKDVDIGLVKSVRLAHDRSHVLAIIDLTKDAESFAVADTRFWVVRPRFAASGVSGLETLLSGAYIGVDAGKSTERTREFKGLEAPPVVTSDSSGKQFVLRAWTWARSTSARRSTTGACRWARWWPSSSIRTGATSRCACSSTSPMTGS